MKKYLLKKINNTFLLQYIDENNILNICGDSHYIIYGVNPFYILNPNNCIELFSTEPEDKTQIEVTVLLDTRKYILKSAGKGIRGVINVFNNNFMCAIKDKNNYITLTKV